MKKETGGEERGKSRRPFWLHGNFPDDKKQQQRYLIKARFLLSDLGEAGSEPRDFQSCDKRQATQTPPPPLRHRDGRTREEAMRSEE